MNNIFEGSGSVFKCLIKSITLLTAMSIIGIFVFGVIILI